MKNLFTSVVEPTEKLSMSLSQNSNILDMIEQYQYLEGCCDKATEELEWLACEVTDKTASESASTNSDTYDFFSDLNSEHGQFASAPDSSSTSQRGVSRIINLSKKFKVPFLVSRSNQEINEQVSRDFLKLEEKDAEISLYLYQLREIESQILEHYPETIEDSVEKIKFISEMVLHGNVLNVDVMAFVVRECAERIDDLVDAIRQVPQKA